MVASLLCCLVGTGMVWVEQFINWRQYRFHVMTVLILAANTALFLILGFLPLMDNFYHVLAMACGALLAPAMLSTQVMPLIAVKLALNQCMPPTVAASLQISPCA